MPQGKNKKGYDDFKNYVNKIKKVDVKVTDNEKAAKRLDSLMSPIKNKITIKKKF